MREKYRRKSQAPGGNWTHNLKSVALQASAVPLCYSCCHGRRKSWSWLTFERFAVILFDALPVVDELLDAAAFQLCRKRKDFGHGRPTFGKKRGRVSEEKAGGLSNWHAEPLLDKKEGFYSNRLKYSGQSLAEKNLFENLKKKIVKNKKVNTLQVIYHVPFIDEKARKPNRTLPTSQSPFDCGRPSEPTYSLCLRLGPSCRQALMSKRSTSLTFSNNE